jgi:hypothetical protein
LIVRKDPVLDDPAVLAEPHGVGHDDVQMGALAVGGHTGERHQMVFPFKDVREPHLEPVAGELVEPAQQPQRGLTPR